MGIVTKERWTIFAWILFLLPVWLLACFLLWKDVESLPWIQAAGANLLVIGTLWIHARPATCLPAEGEAERILSLLPMGISLLDKDGQVLCCNEQGRALLGVDEATVLKMNWAKPAAPLLQVGGNLMVWEDLPVNVAKATGKAAESILGLERVVDGEVAWLNVSVTPRLNARGEVLDLLMVIEDGTKHKQSANEFALMNLRDKLTGLPNKTLFMERLTQALLRTERRKFSLALLFLDLDRFKIVNEMLSHDAGDQLLVQVAKRFRGCMRPEDTVARLGGDEFVVLFEDIADLNAALKVSDRIAKVLTEPFSLEGREVYMTCSMGITVTGDGKAQPLDLLRDAEVAMYRAKAKGNGSIEVFDASMNAEAITRFQMESDLRKALERQEFLLHYQPIVAMGSGRIAGFEALVRWQHPERGLVPPLEFIHLAEETGLIIPIGKWVLEEAIRQSALWALRYPANPARIISVNISGRQFQQQDLILAITQALCASSFSPNSLKLEITESVAMRDPKVSLEAMNILQNLDVHFSIDDFGTGYSSLSYLKRFPVETLKVDKSFVDGLGKDSESTAIVRAVISLAKSLGMFVTAEGIETREQMEQLQALGCDHGQGYYFSRPLPAPMAEALLQKNTAW